MKIAAIVALVVALAPIAGAAPPTAPQLVLPPPNSSIEDTVVALMRDICLPYGASTSATRAIAAAQGFAPLGPAQLNDYRGLGIQPTELYGWRVRGDIVFVAATLGKTTADERQASLAGKAVTASPKSEPTTAFCNIRFTGGDAGAIREKISRTPILGSTRKPADTYDIHKPERTISFWPTKRGQDWRVVNFVVFAAKDARAYTRDIEVTAPASSRLTS